MDSDPNTQIVNLQIEISREAHTELGSMLQSAFNWLYGTCVTLNSGSLFLLITNQSSVSRQTLLLSGAIFCIGIFLALLLAYRTVIRAGKAREMIKQYLQSASLEYYGIEVSESEETRKLAGAIRKGEAISLAIGWLSAAAFFAGVINFGVSLL